MTLPILALTEPVGPDGAPLVVLGPSLGTSTILWERVVPALAARFRVLAWDLPGHGAAPGATAPFAVADVADALAEALGRLGEGPVRYAGVSFAGAVGLELVLRHPDLVARAAILCSAAKIGVPETWADRAAQVRAQGTSSLVDALAQRWFAPGSIERSPEFIGRLLHAVQDADDESYALCCEALGGYDVRDRLGQIAAPVLAVWGAHDAVTPESSAREIAEGVQRGRAVGIPDASHLTPADDAEATARILIDFFEEEPR